MEELYIDNVNLENKLKKLSGKDYTSMKSIIFDHKTQIFVNDSVEFEVSFNCFFKKLFNSFFIESVSGFGIVSSSNFGNKSMFV